MRFTLFFFSLFSLCASAAGASPEAPATGDVRGPDYNGIYASAFLDYFGKEEAASVFGSTSSALSEIKEALDSGVYRQELVILYYVARESSSTFKSAAEEGRKTKSLSSLARKRNLDFISIFEKSFADKRNIDSLFKVKLSSAALFNGPANEKEKKP